MERRFVFAMTLIFFYQEGWSNPKGYVDIHRDDSMTDIIMSVTNNSKSIVMLSEVVHHWLEGVPQQPLTCRVGLISLIGRISFLFHFTGPNVTWTSQLINHLTPKKDLQIHFKFQNEFHHKFCWKQFISSLLLDQFHVNFYEQIAIEKFVLLFHPILVLFILPSNGLQRRILESQNLWTQKTMINQYSKSSVTSLMVVSIIVLSALVMFLSWELPLNVVTK